MLLQELLGEVFEISSAELCVSDDDDLALTFSGDFDSLAKVSSSSIDLDPVIQELLECGSVVDQLCSKKISFRVSYTSKILSPAGTDASIVNLFVTGAFFAT